MIIRQKTHTTSNLHPVKHRFKTPMAGATAAGAIAAAATTSSAVPPSPPVTGKSLISSSYLPSSFPSRERRTNHLRKKILKTLEQKPYPDPFQPEFPRKTHTISIDESLQQQHVESEELSITEGNRFVDGVLGTFSNKSFAKIGLYLVGAFVFQTICAVLIFGLNDLDDDEDDSLSSNDHRNEKKSKAKLELRSDLLLSGNPNLVETKEGVIGLVDESEMDNRIMEIQEMARRAREQEKMEAKRKGLVEEESDDIDYDLIGKTVKKKEVDDRLTKLRRSLEGDYQKLPKVSRKGDGVGDNVDSDSLMFKKKYKYKSPSIDSGDKPKGFNGAKDVRVADGSVINGITVDDGTLQTDKKSDGGRLSNDVRSGSEVSVSKDESKEQEPRATKPEPIAGISKEPKYDKQTSKAEKSGKSNNLESKKPRGFGKESNDTAITSKHEDFSKNGGLKGRRGGNKNSAKKLEDKSSTKTDFWWTRLPYVMAIQMQSGGNGEESSGLFTIRNISGLSHTVAFEDRSDATNFCYLLESFFEELHGFSTNIIPIPTNELVKEVKSQILKVVVVKKGQLKLYIGQPLEDVESALRKLIEQDNEL